MFHRLQGFKKDSKPDYLDRFLPATTKVCVHNNFKHTMNRKLVWMNNRLNKDSSGRHLKLEYEKMKKKFDEELMLTEKVLSTSPISIRKL